MAVAAKSKIPGMKNLASFFQGCVDIIRIAFPSLKGTLETI
jgi:hypothetical protein